MKKRNLHPLAGFTLAELLVGVSVGSMILAAIMAISITLQKSLNATDDFFSTQIQQMRIIDYLNRDVKRSYIVTASADLKTVTCIIPNYISSGARTSPTVKTTVTGTYVSYPNSRSATDAVMTSGSATLSSATASFTGADVGKSIAGANITSGTTIQSVTNSTTITMSSAATGSTANGTITIGASTVVYSISDNSIVRTQDGVVTNIASSTDQLLPLTTDVTQSNTEYTTTQITFKPIFTSGGAAAEQSGTTVYTTSYLRNKRRG